MLGRIVVNSKMLKSRKHKVVTTLFLLFLLNLSLAQEARIKLEHVGYGKTMKEAYFVVSNVGDIPITDVTVYVDGKKVRTLKGGTSPGRSFGFKLFLETGQHVIKVETPEGAEDSITVGVSGVTTIPIAKPQTEERFLEKYKFLAILFLSLTILFISYLLLKKRRVKL